MTAVSTQLFSALEARTLGLALDAYVRAQHLSATECYSAIADAGFGSDDEAGMRAVALSDGRSQSVANVRMAAATLQDLAERALKLAGMVNRQRATDSVRGSEAPCVRLHVVLAGHNEAVDICHQALDSMFRRQGQLTKQMPTFLSRLLALKSS